MIDLLAELGQTASPQDKLKLVCHDIYDLCKKILELTQCGNTAEEFMRDTLEPLIKQEIVVCDELRRDIFGPQVDS